MQQEEEWPFNKFLDVFSSMQIQSDKVRPPSMCGIIQKFFCIFERNCRVYNGNRGFWEYWRRHGRVI